MNTGTAEVLALYGLRAFILAEYKVSRETITAAEHYHDSGSYTYTVTITGGRHHGTEIHCRTLESTIWLFDMVVAHRREGRSWNWLEG